MLFLIAFSIFFFFMALTKLLFPTFLSNMLTKFSGLVIHVESLEVTNSSLSSITVSGKNLEVRLGSVKFEYSLNQLLAFKPFAAIVIDDMECIAFFDVLNKREREEGDGESERNPKTTFEKLYSFFSGILKQCPIKVRNLNLEFSLRSGNNFHTNILVNLKKISCESNLNHEIVTKAETVQVKVKSELGSLGLDFPEISFSVAPEAKIQSEYISCQVQLDLNYDIVIDLVRGLTNLSTVDLQLSKSMEFDLEEVSFSLTERQLHLKNLSLMDGISTVFAFKSFTTKSKGVEVLFECSHVLIQSCLLGLLTTTYSLELEYGCVTSSGEGKMLRSHSLFIRVPILRDIISVGYIDWKIKEGNCIANNMNCTLAPEDLNNALNVKTLLSSKSSSGGVQKKNLSQPLLKSLELNNPLIQFLSPKGKDFCLSLSCDKFLLDLAQTGWTAKSYEVSLVDSTLDQDIFEGMENVTISKKGSSFRVFVKEKLSVHWYSHIHMFLLEWKKSIVKKQTADSNENSSSGVEIIFGTKEADLNLHLGGNDIIVHTRNFCFTKNKLGEFSLKIASLDLDFAGHSDILKASQLSFILKKNQSVWRKEMELKEAQTNDCLEVLLTTVVIRFPYAFDIHQAFTQDVLCYWKWVKLVTLKNKKRSSSATPPPDMVIYAKTVSIEIPDDSFEVRLRDNYELMEDEFFESSKRRKCLTEKIAQLRASNIILPQTKVEELFVKLEEKNADIFVQRSASMRAKTTRRTRLMEVSFTALKFVILSDPSMTGSSHLKRFIQETERESRMPQDQTFSTAILKWLRFECRLVLFRLRDFPQPFIEMNHVLLWGKIGLAEQTSQSREKSKQNLSVPHYGDFSIERGLQSIKVFSDLAMDMSYFIFSHGPCWEPVISQVSISLSFLTGMKKKDPSPHLMWWDKIRYLFHGRLLWSVKILKIFFHTSLDPYNTTEEIELSIRDGSIQLFNNVMAKCDAESLDLHVRTASKYDDCRLLSFPKVKMIFFFDWCCLGDANDHFSVVLCTKDTLPEFSSCDEHDSYRAFRSHNVNVRLSIETFKRSTSHSTIHMFSSTIRWLESLKWLFSGTARPIRRGKVFSNSTINKKSLFRHMKELVLSQHFRDIEIDYWNSASMTKGIVLRVMQEVSLSGKYILEFLPSHDGLMRRPKSNWVNKYTTCQLNDMDVWFQCSGSDEEEKRIIEKSFFFSVDNVQYDRQMHFIGHTTKEAPLHRLTVKGAKCAWTISNRDMTFSLYESWWRAHILREQLSEDALKTINVSAPAMEAQPLVFPSKPTVKETHTGELSMSTLKSWTGDTVTITDFGGDGGDFATVFDQADQYSSSRREESQALIAKLKEDVARTSWLIKCINCQVLLKGSETQGYLILSASKAEVRKDIHKPAYRADTFLSKTSWSGTFEDMQYFATVSPKTMDVDEIFWLPLDAIDTSLSVSSAFQHDSLRATSEDDGYGSVGGVVSHPGVLDQLQRIVAKCKCQFYYVSYGAELLEEMVTPSVVQPVQESLGGEAVDQFVNCFSLVHHDLNVSTNSLQYSVVLDVLNNLLLYLDNTFTMRTENYLRTKCKLMLSNFEDQKKPIVLLQNNIRHLICQLRSKEKEIYYLINNSKQENPNLLKELEEDVTTIKELVAPKSEELNARLRCFHDFQLSQRQKLSSLSTGDTKTILRQKSDIFFSRAQWRLTETDGQLGIADVSIGNFSYTKSVMKDESVEHLLEMGHVSVKNLLKDQAYIEVLSPTALQNVPLDRQRMLRVFCREKPPVGGISVKDHFEVNVAPLTIGITQRLYKKIVAFCFPDRTSEFAEESSSFNSDTLKSNSSNKKTLDSKKKSSSFYVESPLRTDDVEQMKERAKLNKLFVYIKIPEVPICVSFKGEKEKNKILDVANFMLQVPTIEYHNVTWTWLDLFMAVKSKTKDSLISQAIKQKLSLKLPLKHETKNVPFDDEEKAKLLFGNVLLMPSKKK